MKFCQKCGKELFDEAVICVGCGCPVGNMPVTQTISPEEQERINQQRKKNLKILGIIATAVVCVVVFVSFAATFIGQELKKQDIITQISGEKFECNEDTSYSISRKTLTFDDEGNCEYSSYYYGITMDDPMDFKFDWTYKIEFKNNSYYVILSNDDKYKVKMDDGQVIALYDTEYRETYERD